MNSCIIDYIQSVSEKYPDKVAVACGQESYTFSEISTFARQLANVIPQSYKNRPIAVLCNRTAHIAILFLAVIYSGNYYVPVDPDMPIEKIRSILDDALPDYIFGDSETLSVFQKCDYDCTFLTLNDKSDLMCDLLSLPAQTPLYMVYTSGSTGKPKGVLKSHGAMISFIEAYCDTFHFSADEIIGNQTPFFFDASAKDFYLSLKIGAKLEIIPIEKFAMPTELIEYLNERKISFISWVPTALGIVAKLRVFSFIVPQYLTRVFFVGEVMPMKHLNYWRKYLPHLQYVNLYGQSEISGINCWYEVCGQYEDSAVLPMGRPLKNCDVYLMRDENAVTDVGEIGEIYVVSDALATEYFHDAQKTANSFPMMDFGNGPVRAFRSGDLASYDVNGNLLFASRADYQIKHMGHRIELGEIEAVAGGLPDIQRCCCLYDNVKNRIVLFCELSPDSDMAGTAIQSALRSKLSSYMVPNKVVVMSSLPVNANGKINRQQLKERL